MKKAKLFFWLFSCTIILFACSSPRNDTSSAELISSVESDGNSSVGKSSYTSSFLSESSVDSVGSFKTEVNDPILGAYSYSEQVDDITYSYTLEILDRADPTESMFRWRNNGAYIGMITISSTKSEFSTIYFDLKMENGKFSAIYSEIMGSLEDFYSFDRSEPLFYLTQGEGYFECTWKGLKPYENNIEASIFSKHVYLGKVKRPLTFCERSFV